MKPITLRERATSGQTRRELVSGLLLGAAGLVAIAAAPRRKRLKPISQAEAQYQPTPKDIRSCATCTLFVLPDRCKGVLGKVSPDGWCKLYDLAD